MIAAMLNFEPAVPGSAGRCTIPISRSRPMLTFPPAVPDRFNFAMKSLRITNVVAARHGARQNSHGVSRRPFASFTLIDAGSINKTACGQSGE